MLDKAIAEKARDLCQQGYQLFDQGDVKTALRRFYSAWTLIPKPQTQWQEAGWILTALGDAYFTKGDFDNGREALMSALHCPKALGNPVIHLRLGQCLFELDQPEQAAHQFNLVRDHGGTELFAKEDPKYLAHQ
ncbi:MAG TPA: tetratricopeptide repeat protein [Porticoccus sp.]|nr:tetratricopeptide repeat protein [Porticoccus sp.]